MKHFTKQMLALLTVLFISSASAWATFTKGTHISSAADLRDGMYIAIGNSQYYTDYSTTHPEYPSTTKQGYLMASQISSGTWWGTGLNVVIPTDDALTETYIWKLESAAPINGQPAFYFKNLSEGKYIGGSYKNIQLVDSKADALAMYGVDVTIDYSVATNYCNGHVISFRTVEGGFFGPVYNYGGAAYLDGQNSTLYSLVYQIAEPVLAKRITPSDAFEDGMYIAIGNVQSVFPDLDNDNPDRTHQGFMNANLGLSGGAFEWGNGLAVKRPDKVGGGFSNAYVWRLESAGVIDGNESFYFKHVKTGKYVGGGLRDVKMVTKKADALAFYRTDVTFNNSYANADYFDASDTSEDNKLIRFRVHNPDGQNYYFGPGYDYGGAGLVEDDNQTLYSMVYQVENVSAQLSLEWERLTAEDLSAGMYIAIGNVQLANASPAWPNPTRITQGYMTSKYTIHAFGGYGIGVVMPQGIGTGTFNDNFIWKLESAGEVEVDGVQKPAFCFKSLGSGTYIGGTVENLTMVTTKAEAMVVYATEATCSGYTGTEYFDGTDLVRFRVKNLNPTTSDPNDHYFGPAYNYGVAQLKNSHYNGDGTLYSMVFRVPNIEEPLTSITRTTGSQLADGKLIMIGNVQTYGNKGDDLPYQEHQGYMKAEQATASAGGLGWTNALRVDVPQELNGSYIWQVESTDPIDGNPAFYLKNVATGKYVGGTVGTFKDVTLVDSKSNALALYATDLNYTHMGWGETGATYFDEKNVVRFRTSDGGYFGPVWNYGGASYYSGSESSLWSMLYEVTYSDIVVRAYGYGSAVYPFAIEVPAGLTACVVKSFGDANTVIVKDYAEAGDVVPANTPVLFRGAPGSYAVTPTTATGTAPAENLLAGNALTDSPCEYKDIYVLSTDPIDATLPAFRPAAKKASMYIPAGKAYLPKPAPVANAGYYRIIFGEDATGIQTVNAAAAATYYDLQGRKTKQPVKGQIYIKNGKRIIK